MGVCAALGGAQLEGQVLGVVPRPLRPLQRELAACRSACWVWEAVYRAYLSAEARNRPHPRTRRVEYNSTVSTGITHSQGQHMGTHLTRILQY